jgi:hypothetical protein
MGSVAKEPAGASRFSSSPLEKNVSSCDTKFLDLAMAKYLIYALLSTLSNNWQRLCFGLVVSYNQVWIVLTVNAFYRHLNNNSILEIGVFQKKFGCTSPIIKYQLMSMMP